MKRKFWNWIKNEDESVPDMERTLFLNGMISDETWYGDEVTPQLFKDELNAGNGNITVWINSPGGDVFAAAQIYNMLRDYKGSVTVKIDGIAASAASVVAMAGDTVQMSPVAMLMIHDPSTVAMGNTKDMEKAIEVLTDAIRLSRSGLGNERRPVGCFLFAGPTGVGKTEVTQQLGKALGVEVLRFDMSEYMERHTVSRLIGAPPGYVGFEQGGLLTDSVLKHPHSVVLLDEIEKAHPDVFNLLLQVMDNGTLTDNNGRKADFRNVILVMTTNAGVQETQRKSIGFQQQDMSHDAMAVINKTFSPEFRNRLDHTIWFNHLDMGVIHQVVDKFIVELQVQLDAKGVSLEVSEEARHWLAEKGYDRAMGARPMGRVIQEHLKKPLANEILFGSLVDGGIVKVELVNNSLSFDFQVNVEAVSH